MEKQKVLGNDLSPSQAPFRVEMLGGLRLFLPGGSVVSHFRTQKTAALLAYLALHAGKTHSREHLLELFWPQFDGVNGRNNLSTTLSFLRRAFAEGLEPTQTGPTPLFADHRAVGFVNSGRVQTDVADWNCLLGFALWRQPSPDHHAAQPLVPRLKETDSAARRDALEAALALYRGQFLPGFYDGWVCDEQNRFAEQHLNVLRVLIELRQQNNELEAALDLARRGLQTDPYAEDFCFAMLRLFARLNRPSDALALYAGWEKRLRAETLAVPSAPLLALVRQIGGQGRQKAVKAPPAPVLFSMGDRFGT